MGKDSAVSIWRRASVNIVPVLNSSSTNTADVRVIE